MGDYYKEMKWNDKKIVQTNDLYCIEYTEAGPIINLQWTWADTRINPERLEEMKSRCLTFDEARKIVVDWYITRAETIEGMSEEDYIASKNNISSFNTFRKHAAKEVGG